MANLVVLAEKPKQKVEKAKPSRKERHITSYCRGIKKLARAKVNQSDLYHWLKTTKNPEYDNGLKSLPFESCLIHNFGNKFASENSPNSCLVSVQTKPKYITQLAREKFNPKTDNWEGYSIIETNSFKQANHRKIKALNRFCEKYQPLYKDKKVTLYFLTFTRMNKARLTFKTMMRIVTQYFKRIDFPVKDYIWTLEVSENLHAHYHLCLAVDRMQLKNGNIPKQLKFNKIWGQRTEIDFVKKNVRNYLSKYFAKNNYRLQGYYSYGISKIKQ
jgi:hypothetical protein